MCTSTKSIYVKEHDCCYVVPCGYCPDCLQSKVDGWAFRLRQEMKRAHTAQFITLTYDDNKLPFSEQGIPTLYPQDLTNFWKRLRKANNQKAIKYYAVGEYGTETQRPHYHAIVFNMDLTLTQHPFRLDKIWKNGSTQMAPVNESRIYYTLKYMLKRVGKEFWNDQERVREFARMSRGLGSNFLTPEMIKYINEAESPYLTDKNGKKVPMPRYYREKAVESITQAKIRTKSWQQASKKNQEQIQELIKKAPKQLAAHQKLTWAMHKLELKNQQKAEVKWHRINKKLKEDEQKGDRFNRGLTTSQNQAESTQKTR